MEPEREVATVHGLGRGNLLGFSLIVTDQKIVGIDTRRSSTRLWLSMMLGLGLGMILVLLVLFSGLEPVLFRTNPLLSFVTMLLLIFSRNENQADEPFHGSSTKEGYYSDRSP